MTGTDYMLLTDSVALLDLRIFHWLLDGGKALNERVPYMRKSYFMSFNFEISRYLGELKNNQ